MEGTLEEIKGYSLHHINEDTIMHLLMMLEKLSGDIRQNVIKYYLANNANLAHCLAHMSFDQMKHLVGNQSGLVYPEVLFQAIADWASDKEERHAKVFALFSVVNIWKEIDVSGFGITSDYIR